MSIAIKRSFTVPTTSALNAADLFLTSSAASTSPTSGSLQVLGGVGISGAISLAGPLRLFNGSYYTGFDSAATANTTYIWPATSPSTGTSVLSSDAAGNLSWVLMSASGSGLTLNGLSVSTQYFATSISGNGFTVGSTGSTHSFYIGLAGFASTGLISSANQTIFGTKTFASGIAITSGIASNSTTTGDLTVAGGVGIGGSLFTQTLTVGSGITGLIIQKMVGANYVAMYSTNVTPSGTNYTFITDGQSPNFNGTFGVYFNINNSNKVQITNTNINITPTTSSTSSSTGSLTVAGGAGIAGSLWTGLSNFSSISGVGHLNGSITSGAWSGTAISAVNGGTGLSSFTTGDILYASSFTTISRITAGSAGSVLTSAGAGTTPYWSLAASTGVTTINGITSSIQFYSTGIGGSSFNISSSGSTHTFNIPLAGSGVTGLISPDSQTIAGDKTFSGNLAVSGNLTVNGTTTTVNSTITTIVDPVITIGTSIGGTNPSTDDNKDRGIEFKYYSGTAKTGFFGFDDSTGYFTFIPDASNSSEVFSGTTGVLDVTRITGSSASWTNSRTVTFAGGGVTGSFSLDGSANVSSVSLNIDNDAVALGTKTTGQYASTISISGSGITATSTNASDGTAYTIYSSAISTNTASSIVLRDASGNFSAGTITANTFSGNATTSTSAGLAGTAVNAGSAFTSTNAGLAFTSTFSGSAFTATNAGSAGTSITAGSAGTAVNAGSATTSTSAGTAGTATNAGSAGTSVSAGTAGTAINAGSAGTSVSAGTAATATNAGSAGTSITAGSAGTAVNAGSAGTSVSAGTAATATNAGSAATSTNAANTNIILDTTSTIYLTGSRSSASIGATPIYVLSGISASGNTLTATTFSGNATTSTSAGLAGTSVTAGTAGTATNAGSAGTSISAGTAGTATNAGTAGTATNAGTAGTATNAANTNIILDTTSTIYLTGSRSNASIGNTPIYVLTGVSALGNTITATTFSGNATTSTNSGLAGTSVNAGSAGTSIFSGSAGTAINAGSAGTSISAGTAGTATNAGSAGTSVSAGTAGTATNAGSAGTATNSANTNILLDTTSTIYLTGSRSNASIGNTPIYVLSGISALGSTITATTFSGNATTSTSAGIAGTAINAGSAGTSIFSGSAGTSINAGSAGTSISSGLAGTSINAGFAATATNTANTNVVLDTTSTIYLTGSRSNASIGSTPVYLLSGVSALGNTITATTFSGSLSGTASSSALINVSSSTATRFLATVLSNSSVGSTQLFTGSGITVGDNRLTAGGITITSGTASTNTSTGALIVAGGVGITGQLSVNTVALGNTGVSATPSMTFTGSAGTVISMSVLSDTTLTWEGSSGQLFSIDNNLSSGEIFSVSDISGLPIISASAGQSIYLNEFGGFTQVGNGLASTNTNTGALRVVGGVGITGAVNIAGNTNISSSTASTSTSTGALVVTGGVGIGSSVNIAGNTTISSNTSSTSTTTGALVVSGGVGVGASVNIAGNTIISSNTSSTSATTGALVVTGGAGIGGTLNIGGNIRAGTNIFSKSGIAAGDILLDNGTVDTPGLLFYWGNNRNMGIDTFYGGTGATRIRIVKELNESGGAELWSIDRNGIITRSAWDVGEVIASRMYNYTDLNMSATTTVGINTYVRIANITYTPKSSSSHIWIEFSCSYEIAGAAADDFYSNITVNGTEIVYNRQIWINGTGGGTRSGILFPISARYTNSSTSGIAITVQASRGSSDDNGSFFGAVNSGFMRIMEIGR